MEKKNPAAVLKPPDLKTFTELLSERLKQPLPGAVAHEPMRALPMGNLKPRFEFAVPPRPGSVLILLYPDEGSIKFPLTLRADYAGTHGGQVSLPGGKAEAGEDFKETALRECEEEVGVPRNLVTVIGRLSDFFVIPSNFMVTPVIGYCESKPKFVPDPVEVVRILEGDVERLIQDDAIREKELLAAKQFKMRASYFEIDGEVVWGATAMMLNEFRTIVREVLLL
jgi:8-oxo-dGTP pyrophosphatase MutT (NUDIX family)